MADEIAATPAAEQGAPEPQGTTPAAQPENVAAQPNANGGAQPGAKTFTQDELNAIVAQRIKDEQRKAQEKADKARLEAQGEYQKRYEAEQAKTAAAESRAKELELAGLRRDAAAKFGLPAALADRLKGETLDDLEADARAVLAALPKPAAPNINATGGGNAAGSGLPDDVMREKAIRYGVNPELFKQQYRGR